MSSSLPNDGRHGRRRRFRSLIDRPPLITTNDISLPLLLIESRGDLFSDKERISVL